MYRVFILLAYDSPTPTPRYLTNELTWHTAAGMAKPFYTRESAENFLARMPSKPKYSAQIEYFDIGDCD